MLGGNEAGAPGGAKAGCCGCWYGRLAGGAPYGSGWVGTVGVEVLAGAGGVADALGGPGAALCFAMLASTSMMLAPLGGGWEPVGCVLGSCDGLCAEPGNPGGGLPGGVVEVTATRVVRNLAVFTMFDPALLAWANAANPG